jgi:hypothetical protein
MALRPTLAPDLRVPPLDTEFSSRGACALDPIAADATNTRNPTPTVAPARIRAPPRRLLHHHDCREREGEGQRTSQTRPNPS